MKKQIWKNVGQTLAAIAFLWVVWLVAYLAVGNELLVPAFSDCLEKMGELLTSAIFWRGFLGTLSRTLSAFVISFVLALIFAVASYLVPSLERLFAPVVSAFRSLPVLAVLLILLSFLNANGAPVAVAFLSIFPLLYVGILAALSGIDRELIAVSKVHGTPWYRRVYKVYLPLSAPYILRESGAAFSFSLKLVVSAEVLASTAKSLGGMMQEAKVYAEIPQLFALVTLSFFAGLAIELLFSLLTSSMEKRLKG